MKRKQVQCKHLSDEVILEAVRRYHAKEALSPDIALAQHFPVKVVLAKMQKMVDRGILDYGVSLRTAFLRRGPF